MYVFKCSPVGGVSYQSHSYDMLWHATRARTRRYLREGLALSSKAKFEVNIQVMVRHDILVRTCREKNTYMSMPGFFQPSGVIILCDLS